ncbi:hypothetical protein F9288_16820 [Sphingomonas sp. CL5.1]|uniref:hypothetical protein n=1 Tax=Sphingomonas sp. CL5.1 TaxID=2653203 RepID=UPI0015829455|nr:hypothetical protein [Sphingomonas sp. CL5.1]QKS01105.1 hypothetical protein F9288_16820 [Sphingomonas sp. CL5.1]
MHAELSVCGHRHWRFAAPIFDALNSYPRLFRNQVIISEQRFRENRMRAKMSKIDEPEEIKHARHSGERPKRDRA